MPKASRDMSLHPFNPPNSVTYGVIVLMIAAFLIFVKPNREGRLLTIVKAYISFIPAAVGSAWIYWSTFTLCRSGSTGPIGPDEVLALIYKSFWLGAGLTFGLVVLNIFIPCFTSRKGRFKDKEKMRTEPTT